MPKGIDGKLFWGQVRCSGAGLMIALALSILSCHKTYRCEREFRDMHVIIEALHEYKVTNGKYPDALDDLLTGNVNNKALLQSGIYDQWGRPYRYRGPSDEKSLPLIYTLGADGAPGGTGENADVDSSDCEWPD